MSDEVGKLSLKFGVEKHEIDAAVYGQVLINTVRLIEEANHELRANAHFHVRVTAETKSSFLTDMILLAATLVQGNAHLFSAENFETAKKFAKPIISLVGSALDFRKETGGERPNEVTHVDDGSVVVKGNNYGTINTNNHIINLVFENPVSEKAIQEIFAALDSAPEIEDIELLDEDGQPLFEAEKKDFKQMSKKTQAAEHQKRIKVDKDAVLSIARQSFEKDKTSDFFYQNRPITASIVDATFWEAIDRGERFAKGDKLFVDLEITQDFDKALDDFVDKGYKILVVNQHVPRPEQPNLFS